jgi:hypothetical protein
VSDSNHDSEAASALLAFANLQLDSWQGLPEDCSMADARRAFALSDEDDGRGDLGKERELAYYQSLDDRPLRIWHRESRVVLLDFENPSDDFEVSRILGPPSAKLSVAWGFATLEDGEWVYPERGLSAIVLSTGMAAHLYGFTPASVDAYVRSLRVDRVRRPMPEARSGRG